MEAPGIRLAEFVGALSRATDLSVGCPMETALRCSLLAVRLGAELGCDDAALRDAYQAARLLGCTGAAHHRPARARQPAAPAGLSPREHVQHVYEKTGVSSRAAAALYAVRNDLIGSE